MDQDYTFKHMEEWMERERNRADKAEEKCARMRKALEYVYRWWDETGRDEGWHKSIGIKVEEALKK